MNDLIVNDIVLIVKQDMICQVISDMVRNIVREEVTILLEDVTILREKVTILRKKVPILQDKVNSLREEVRLEL